MRLAYALLADAAHFSRDGHLSLIGGGIDRIPLSNLPAALASISTVVSVLLSRDDLRAAYQVSILLEDPSGEHISVGWSFSIDTIEDAHIEDVPPKLNFAATLRGVLLSVPGTHAFRIIVEGETLVRLPFHVYIETPSVNATE